MGIETSLPPEDSTITTYNLQNSHFFFLSYSRLVFISSGFFTTVREVKVSMYNTRQQNGNCGGKGN